MPRILREVGGLVIAEDGPLVIVVDRGNGPPAIAAFVAGVFTVVFGGFGAVSLVAGSTWLGVVFVAVGVVAAVVTAATVRHIRRKQLVPVDRYRPVAVFDRAARTYCDADGQVVAPLDAVIFHRRIQVGSSSPKLVAQTPSGAFVLLRGNPFTGGLGDLDSVLADAIAT
jgi:hypothetical protein